MKFIALVTAALAAAATHAHDGHGLEGSHWHAGDSLGFIALALALAGAIWASRRK
jgi:hypothetical protein